MTLTEFVGQHPLVGASVTAIHMGGAALLQVSDVELPVIVMQLFQVGAWTVAMAAGAFTIYGVLKTHHGKKNGKR
jgi:hypothetical protein